MVDKFYIKFIIVLGIVNVKVIGNINVVLIGKLSYWRGIFKENIIVKIGVFR